MSVPFSEENDQTRARQEHLEALRQLVGNVYPNKFERSRTIDPHREDTITTVVEKYRSFEPPVAEGERPAPEPIELANQQLNAVAVRVAGRIASPPRIKGKTAFVHLSDGVTRLQVYVRRDDVKAVNNSTGNLIDREDKGWELLKLLDHGDFIGVEGYLFITKTGELTVHVKQLQFLAKALLPMPHKIRGITDSETRRRQRYVDLIAGSLKIEPRKEEEEEDDDDDDADNVGSLVKPKLEELTPREVFERRSAVIREMRRILDDHGYIEVETPMLTPLATGAAARPFKTHHHALNIDLYARIAPELYLKRLLVGGFEKVYELNRNFRNEGIDRTHNPEFTMLEFYWAYADVNQMMNFCEELIRTVVSKALGQTNVKYGLGDSSVEIDFSRPFERLTMRQAIVKNWPQAYNPPTGQRIDESWLQNPIRTFQLVTYLLQFTDQFANLERNEAYQDVPDPSYLITSWNFAEEHAQLLDGLPREAERDLNVENLFAMLVESKLTSPTFITDFPKSISPLSKASPANPSVAERFELFIVGMECANGFSELNDPAEQHQRFVEQMSERERGDEEAMVMDDDYIRALSYGMPPAAGIGIGIDRFVMLVTNKHSIRDVILFPHMRPERKAGDADQGEDQDAPEQAEQHLPTKEQDLPPSGG